MSIDKINLKREWHDALLVLGIMHGAKAYTGPTLAQLDITNRCNNNCIACWVRSPLLQEREATSEWKSAELPFEKIRSLLDELSEMGTKRIFLAGGGEPFIHPGIFKILAYIKEKGMSIDMNTNFTLIDEKSVKKIISLGVDHINVSLWAGNAKTYCKTHPNKDKKTFLKIEKMLKLLSKTKDLKPVINIYNVLLNLNYHEFKSMLEFGFKVKADTIDFVLVDVIPGKTDKLLLNATQRKELISELEKTDAYLKRFKEKYKHNLQIPLFEQFKRRVLNPNMTKGIYENNIIESIPCYAGWSFTRISATGNVDPCLKAHKISVGNIYEKSFNKIWSDKKQKEFRKKTFVKIKKGPYFSMIGEDSSKKSGCYFSCDNLGLNFETHEKIRKFSSKNKLFKLVSKVKWKNLI